MTFSITYKAINYPDAIPNGNSVFLSKREPSGWGSSFEFSPDIGDKAFGYSNSISGNFSGGAGEDNFNTWKTAFYVHDNDSIKIYLDGEIVQRISSPGSFNSNTLDVTIGMRGNGWHGFKGHISNIGLWNRALSDSELYDLYNGTENNTSCTDTVLITVYDTVTTNVTIYDTITTQFNSSIPTSGLVAYYPFNGNASDESGNSNDGKVSGATLTTDRFGNANSAYSFDGVDDYIEVSGNSSLLNDSLSLSLWFKSSNKALQYLLYKADENAYNEEYALALNYYSENNVAMIVKTDNNCSNPGSGWRKNETNFNSNNDVWHHIVATYIGNKSNVFIDNIEIAELDFNPEKVIDKCGGRLLIGRGWKNNTEFFNGKIDDLTIYDKELTKAEIDELYNATDKNTSVTDTVLITVQDTLNIYLSEIVTSINDASQALATVKVYPNPTDENLTVSIDNYTNLSGVTIKVLDALGTVVHQQLITGSTQSIDVNSWTVGVYFLHVMNGNKTVDIKKIVVNN